MEQLGTTLFKSMLQDPISFGQRLNDWIPVWLLLQNLVYVFYGRHWPIDSLLFFNVVALAHMAGYRWYYGQMGTRRGEHQQ